MNMMTRIQAQELVASDRREWDHAMATYLRAEAEDKAFDPIYERIHDAWLAGRPTMDAIHWREFPFVDRAHTARKMDLEKAWQHFLDGEAQWWWGGSPEGVERMKARQRAALDSVQEFRDAEATHKRESGMDEADARYEALGEAVIDALDTVMNTPSPDLAALRWKLDYLTDAGTDFPSWSEDFVRQTFADMARLLPQGR